MFIHYFLTSNSNFKTTLNLKKILISPNFANPLRKTISSQIYPKIYKKSQNIEFLDYLKSERDISIKPTLSGEKATFQVHPTLIESRDFLTNIKLTFLLVCRNKFYVCFVFNSYAQCLV